MVRIVKRTITAILICFLLGALVFWLFRPLQEVEGLTQYKSPDGKWIAQVGLFIYGNRWFTTGAAEEVHLIRTDGSVPESIVYSVEGFTDLVVRWKADSTLIVEDSSKGLSKAYKERYPLQIHYCANDNGLDRESEKCK